LTIRWLPEARADLDRIDAFWRAIQPELAMRAAACILDMAESLETHGSRGRASRVDSGTREIVSRFGAGAFILRYRNLGDDVMVVQVRHSRERPPWL